MSTAAQPAKPRPLVLLAEDDPALIGMNPKILGEIAEVVQCRDGMEAYEYLRTTEKALPKLIITDVMMPRLDGMQLVAKLRLDARLAQIPVIMLTAKGTPKDVITGITAGVRHYITKPFKQDDFLTKVKKTLVS